jgi:hypothetical protein
VIMALNSRLQTIGRVTGVAATTAPTVRRLARDEKLRDDVADLIRSANNLATHVRSDKRLARDARDLVRSAQSGADHLRGDLRPRRILRTLFIGTGLLITSFGIGIALAWPRSRRTVLRVADQTTQRANATVHDVRERIAGQRSDAKAA